MTTTNVEKLVYNIFERKNWIIEQVKQQTYLYEQQLASNLLIQGINPPSWFLNTHSHSLSSDPKGIFTYIHVSVSIVSAPVSDLPFLIFFLSFISSCLSIVREVYDVIYLFFSWYRINFTV